MRGASTSRSAFIPVEVTPSAFPGPERIPARNPGAANVHREITALDKAAPREVTRKRRHGTSNDGKSIAAFARIRKRIEELARVRMRRSGEEAVAIGGLD